MMRQRSGCKACRERHIKCVKLLDSEKCKYCTDKKKSCIKGNTLRFRPVKTVKFNAGEDIGELSLDFRVGQTWVNIPDSIHFVAPNTDGEDGNAELQPAVETVASSKTPSDEFFEVSAYEESSQEHVQEQHLTRSGNKNDASLLQHHASTSVSDTTAPTFDSGNELPSIHDVLDTHIVSTSRINNASVNAQVVSSNFLSPSSWHKSPSLPHKSPLGSNNNISPYASSTFSPTSSLISRWPVNNAYEARLFHHYITHCTDFIDVCDSKRHFQTDVPVRAAHFPVILNGILGLAARHVWLMKKAPDDHSQSYVDKCLEALIVALEDPLAHWDENFLVAVILLRLHEEMGQSDEQCHHFGTARILNSISSFAADGGLRESASWVSLRQHIYVSLTTQQPIGLSLDNYRYSSVFREFDNEAWANRIILLFATVLQSVFEDSNAGSLSLSKERWNELDTDVEEWNRTKPWTFSPLHAEAETGEKFNGSWPELFCTEGVVAVGLQYYHLCRILLAIYSPNISLVGLSGVRARKTVDAAIRKHIRIVIGYGVSNANCANAMFQGSHILSACGAYVVDEREREACVEYLKRLQTRMGWRTDTVLADLREQWST